MKIKKEQIHSIDYFHYFEDIKVVAIIINDTKRKEYQ